MDLNAGVGFRHVLILIWIDFGNNFVMLGPCWWTWACCWCGLRLQRWIGKYCSSSGADSNWTWEWLWILWSALACWYWTEEPRLLFLRFWRAWQIEEFVTVRNHQWSSFYHISYPSYGLRLHKGEFVRFIHSRFLKLLLNLSLEEVQLILHVPVDVIETLFWMIVIAILALLVSEGWNHSAIEFLDFPSWILPSFCCWWTLWSNLSYS